MVQTHITGLVGGGGFKEPFKGLDNKSLYKTIYLYLPTGIKENYQAQYNEASLGAIGAGALQGLSGDMNPVEAFTKNSRNCKTRICYEYCCVSTWYS